jgi:hypothetical protein
MKVEVNIMSRQTKKGKGEKIGSEVMNFIIENRDDVPVNITHGSVSCNIEDGVLTGGHFKIRSAFKQAGLSEQEIAQALS